MENDDFLGRKVLVYQKFKENFHPDSPFPAIILKDLRSRWLVKYLLLDGNWTQKSLSKGVCSSKPIDKSVDKTVVSGKNVLQSTVTQQEKPGAKRSKIRRKLPIKPRI